MHLFLWPLDGIECAFEGIGNQLGPGAHESGKYQRFCVALCFSCDHVMANTDEDLNAISTLYEEGSHHGPHVTDNGEWVDLLQQSREPVRDPVAIRGAGNVTVYV